VSAQPDQRAQDIAKHVTLQSVTTLMI
jgi:hypothetical protein